MPEIRVEVLLDEGTRLFVLREPFGPAADDGPGAIRFAEGDVRSRRPRADPPVRHERGEHPIRVSSFPFWRANAHLEFDRTAADGSDSTCPPATPSDGRPGRRTEVDLVRYGGTGA